MSLLCRYAPGSSSGGGSAFGCFERDDRVYQGTAGEGVAVDADGNVFAAEGPNSLAQAGGAFTKCGSGVRVVERPQATEGEAQHGSFCCANLFRRSSERCVDPRIGRGAGTPNLLVEPIAGVTAPLASD
jgi:hypothetical protein